MKKWSKVGVVVVLLFGAGKAALAGQDRVGWNEGAPARVEQPVLVVDPGVDSGTQGGSKIRFHVEGPATCNCTQDPATFQICHKESVEVNVGSGGPITVSTGQSTSTCVTQEIPAGRCDFYVYNVVCVRVTHWFFFTSWECWVESSALHTRQARPADCALS